MNFKKRVSTDQAPSCLTKPMAGENPSRGCVYSSHGAVKLLAAGPGWLTVDKPSGLSVHNAPGSDLRSLVAAALPQLGLPEAFGDSLRAVHRLDRATSGVVLLAWSKDTLRNLAKQFEAGTVRKRYLALLHGRLPAVSTPDHWGLWSGPLTRAAGGRLNPAGRGIKIDSKTRYRVRGYTRHYTLAQCEPLTGRKHQIRRHARLAGHAIVGDPRYGTARAARYLAQAKNFQRLGLHAISLQFQSPSDGHRLTVTSPAWPEAIWQLLRDDQ